MMPQPKSSSSTNIQLSYQYPFLGSTTPNMSSSGFSWEQEQKQQTLAEICDSIHEVSSDMFIITAFKDLNPAQKNMCKEKLEDSLERLYTLIEKNKHFVFENSSVCLVLYDMLGALEKILPGIFKRMPSFKCFRQNIQK